MGSKKTESKKLEYKWYELGVKLNDCKDVNKKIFTLKLKSLPCDKIVRDLWCIKGVSRVFPFPGNRFIRVLKEDTSDWLDLYPSIYDVFKKHFPKQY